MAERFVGLDIGTSAIRAAEVTVGEGARPVLESYGQVGLSPGAVVDGEVRNRAEVVAALQRLWREGGFSEKKVILGIAGLRAITRELDMPPLPPEELDSAVRFQADQVVPFPMDQTALSTKVIAQYTDAEGTPQIRVLVAAAHRELIDAATEAITEAGLEPIGIDLNTAALARALYDPTFTGGPEAIVSVGAGLTMVVVHQGGQLQFIRTIDLGGNNVTKAVASALDLPMADAEVVKRRLGEPGIHDTRAESAAAQAVDELVSEIHNSVRFFSSLPGRGAPSRLLVTGAGARTVGFLSKLQGGIDVPVVPASPLAMIDSRLPISPDEAASINPTLAVPVGLALPDPAGKPFNLLPAEVTARFVAKRVLRVMQLAAVVIVLALVALLAWRILGVRNAQHQVTTLTAQLTQIKTVEIPKFNTAVQLQGQVQSEEANLLPIVSNEVDWLVALNAFGSTMTTTSVMSNMDLTQAPPRTTTTTKKKGKATSSSSTPVVLGTGTGSVTVTKTAGFSSFGTAMLANKVITIYTASVTLTTATTITYTITYAINSEAHSHRTSLFATTP